jgi:prolyl oligopeptidase
VLNGDGGEVAHYVMDPDGAWHQVTRFADGIRSVTLGPDGALYLVSRAAAPRGKVLRLPPGDYTLAHARTIVPEGESAIVPRISALQVAKDRLYVTAVNGGPTEVRIYDTNGDAHGTLPAPPVSTIDDVTPFANGDLLFSVEGFTRPAATIRYEAATGRSEATPLVLTSAIRFDDAEVERAVATSKDGTQVPYTMIRRKGTPADGSAPALMTGYGGYGVIIEPRFAGARARLWLDAGGVFVVANIRGGGEYGEPWHQQGSLTRKQNVFDDFTAVAEDLVARKVTSHDRLALTGGSNGGLLMGAVVTQHPTLARAVLSVVGIYDTLRVENDPNGAFNTTEFGTVKDKEQFEALYAYSPYHHVTDGAPYPAVLFQTGDTDGRVNPLQSRKMTARLQAATGSDRPILLETRADAGHGIGSSRAVILDQMADGLAFLFDQLGVPPVLH